MVATGDKSPTRLPVLLIPSGKRAISNDAGHCKSFFSYLTLDSSTLLRRRRNCVSLKRIPHPAQVRLRDSWMVIQDVPRLYLVGCLRGRIMPAEKSLSAGKVFVAA
jgi:hypothetical protein